MVSECHPALRDVPGSRSVEDIVWVGDNQAENPETLSEAKGS